MQFKQTCKSLDTLIIQSGAHVGKDIVDTLPLNYLNIFCRYSSLAIFNVPKLIFSLQQILTFLSHVVLRNGRVLLVDYNPVFCFFSQPWLAFSNQPFVFDRWIPGFLTNFREFLRLLYKSSLKNITSDNNVGENNYFLRRYYRTLYSSVHASSYFFLRREIMLPDVIFTFSFQRTGVMLLEASKLGVPITGVINSDLSPHVLTYSVCANDTSIYALYLYLSLVAQVTGSARLVQAFRYRLSVSHLWLKHFSLQMANRLYKKNKSKQKYQ